MLKIEKFLNNVINVVYLVFVLLYFTINLTFFFCKQLLFYLLNIINNYLLVKYLDSP